MSYSDEHLVLARADGHATRRLLAMANIGGIGVLVALAALLAAGGVSPRWAFPAVGLLSVGVLCAVGGDLVSQYRATTSGGTTGAIEITWNLASLVFLLAGAVLGAYRFLDRVQDPDASAPPAEEAAARLVDPARPADSQPDQYAAIIDAGSNGSRLWIFTWLKVAGSDPEVTKEVYVEAKEVADNKGYACPLAKITTAEDQTCKCLTYLLAEGHRRLAAAAGLAITDLPLWVKATGGVRKEKMPRQIDILKKTNSCLKATPHYSWRGAEAIGGSNEALYAWLALNYHRGTLRQNSHGIVEIGGESAQIAFRVEMPIAPKQRGHVVTVPLSPDPLFVYAYSDALGKDAVVADLGGDVATSIRMQQCGLKGDVDKCEEEIEQFLCARAKPCLERGPEFPPDRKISFVGLSNFMHVVSNIGLDNKASLSDVLDLGKKACGAAAPNPELQKSFTTKTPFDQDVCLDALYTTSVASKAWGLPLTDVRPADKSDMEWPFGAMFMAIAQGTI